MAEFMNELPNVEMVNWSDENKAELFGPTCKTFRVWLKTDTPYHSVHSIAVVNIMVLCRCFS